MTLRKSQHKMNPLFTFLSLLALTACAAPGIVAGAATAGLTVAQERSIGTVIDDTAIELQIQHYLLQASDGLFIRVGIEVHEGRVLLTGVVPAPDDRVEAVRQAWQVNGVLEVINEVQVSDRAGITDYLRDVKITSQLRFKMLRDRDISDVNYTVETVNGIVYLMGMAGSRPELDKVTTQARNIAGVQKVISHVRLSGDDRRGKS